MRILNVINHKRRRSPGNTPILPSKISNKSNKSRFQKIKKDEGFNFVFKSQMKIRKERGKKETVSRQNEPNQTKGRVSIPR